MEKTQFKSALVRILTNQSLKSADRQAVGAGFLISSKHIITCAHVIKEALGIDSDPPEFKKESVYLDFPLLSYYDYYETKILGWYPVKESPRVGDIEDLAILELSDEKPLPNDAQQVFPAHIEPFDLFNTKVVMCGFPDSFPNGLWINGKVMATTGTGWVQINPSDDGQIAEPGFSGTAVWNKQGEVIGILVSTHQKARLNYMIPAANIIAAYHNFGPIDFSKLESPSGWVRPDSSFYVERPGEREYIEGILRPHAVLRIRAPRQFGKTSLLHRVLECAKNNEAAKHEILYFSFQEFDRNILSDFDKLVAEFCNLLLERFKKKNCDAMIDKDLSRRRVCTKFFEQCILAESQNPIVLAIDEADLLFDNKEICTDFFGMLRSWADMGGNGLNKNWEKFKLVIAYSTEAKIDQNESPFNLGDVMKLDEFGFEQVKGLVGLYKLDWDEKEIKELMQMIGGHPYLVRKALFEIAVGRIKNLKELISTATHSDGPFGDHLRRHSWNLKHRQRLEQEMKNILINGICGDSANCNKLRDLGLIIEVSGKFEPRFKIYKEYFNGMIKDGF